MTSAETLTNPETANCHKIERFDLHVYEPNPEKPGMLRKVRNRTPEEVVEAMRQCLKDCGLWGSVDYLGTSFTCLKKSPVPPYRGVVVYFQPGGCEGYYIDVAVICREGNKFREIASIKTYAQIN
jgi:hypothetical protein